MAVVPTSYNKAGARGTPAFENLDEFTQQNLLASASPPQGETLRVLLGDSLTLAQFSVVGLNSAGKLVLATYNVTPASAIKPIGVLAFAATSGSSNTTKHGEVWLTGDYNAGDDSPLVWDATYDTLAKKTAGPLVVGNPNLMFRSRKATGSPAA